MSKASSPDRQPTWTAKVDEALRLADDFRSSKQLAEQLQAKRLNQILAALWWLRKCKVVDSVESDGKLYWFYIGHESDSRIRTVDERRPEDKPRKARGGRAKPGEQVRAQPLDLTDNEPGALK